MGKSENRASRHALNNEASGVRFDLQAIAHAGNLAVYGYEFLYRGQVRPSSADAWTSVDQGVLRYLASEVQVTGKPCFINLSHESVLAIQESSFAAACKRNDLRFEMSEAIAEGELFDLVCDKVNHLCGRGMQFAIDDFGAGLDGSRRIYALDSVSAIKVDRNLLVCAASRPQAARMLAASVSSWRSAGIQTVAEGVESPELLDFARDVGFDLVQGWHVDTLAPSKRAVIPRSFF